jgi:myo-inositol-1(or 4)-monophosphatase
MLDHVAHDNTIFDRTMFDSEDLSRLEQIIRATSDDILTPFFNNTIAQDKSDGSIVTEADVKMQEGLRAALADFAPGIKLLGEEMDPASQQAIIDSDDDYWCLDPLDGTNNFHHGIPLFSVSVALISQRQVVLGMVYDPVRAEMFSALKGQGLRINGIQIRKLHQPEELARCIASVDFKRLKMPLKQHLAQYMPFKSQRNVGSCALEWAWLAAGRVQLLLHGGEKFWDYAAGTLLNEEAGGVSCDLEGLAIFNNSLHSRPVVGASTRALHRDWLSFLRGDA